METLDLYDDPEFATEATPAAKLLERLTRLSQAAMDRIPPNWHAWLGLSTADAETALWDALEEEGSAAPVDDDFDEREVAALIFASHLDVNYSDGSYVMRVSFSSLDPERSAAVANHIAELHVQKQLQAKRNGARRAITWMDKKQI